MAKKLYKNKKVIVILAIVAVAAVGAAGYVWRNNHKSTPPSSYDTSKPENQESAVDPKKDTDNAQRQNAASNNSSSNSASASNVTPQITYFGQANGMVILDATVNGATSGTCSVTFKNGGSTVTKTSSVSLVTSYYACGEIQAPSSEFNPKGSWSATVTLNNGPASPPVEANIN